MDAESVKSVELMITMDFMSNSLLIKPNVRKQKNAD